jgi:hypothetical protein
MEKGIEIYVNCGSFRPKWFRSKREHVTLHFAFSLEVPASEQSEVSFALRESIAEMLTEWSRSCWVKLQNEADKRRKVKECRK